MPGSSSGDLVRVEICRSGKYRPPPSILVHSHDGSSGSDVAPSTVPSATGYQSAVVSFPVSSHSSENLTSLMSEEANMVVAYGYPNGPQSTKSEAMEYFRSRSLKDYQRVVCPRPGCNRTVANLRAFAAHLDTHKIDDRSFKCSTCSHRYETKKEIAMHMCGGRVPPPSDPDHRSSMKGGLGAVTKWLSFRSKTK